MAAAKKVSGVSHGPDVQLSPTIQTALGDSFYRGFLLRS
jgi:hypothetical protein